MRKILLLFVLIASLFFAPSPFGTNCAFAATTQSYTEFYIQTTGDNLNSGHTADDAATFTATSGFFTNNTTATTCTYFKNGLNPVAGGVTNGAWASVYPDGSLATGWIGTVTAADDTADTITLSLTAKAGNLPATDETGVTSIKVGGAWKGSGKHTADTGYAATNTFPTALVANTMTNSSQDVTRINVKGGTEYQITNAMTFTGAGPIVWSGYTNTPGDGGFATISGPTTYTSFVLGTVSGANVDIENFIFATNGNSGTATALLHITGAECIIRHCVFHDARRSGLYIGIRGTALECEAYSCNLENATSSGGIVVAGDGAFAVRCISHGNTGGANCHGLYMGNTIGLFVNCISDGNSGSGIYITSGSGAGVLGCDSYNNSVDGLYIQPASASGFYVENCNFVKNGGFGIASSANPRNGYIISCGFGSGTQANSSGDFDSNITGPRSGLRILNTITYPANQVPWADPANGNFSINLTQSKAAGRGSFTETATSYSGTVSYPDIGAAQTASTNAASSGGAWTFSQ